MRTINSSLQTRLSSGTTQLCRLFTITRQDGVVHRFTDLDINLTFDGNIYYASNSMSIANVSTGSQGGITSTNARLILDASSGLESIDALRGKFDGASVKVSWVDWLYPAYGEIIILIGLLATTELSNRGRGQIEVRGLLNRGDMRIGEFYTAECTADLGDDRCTIDLAPTVALGTVDEALTRTKINTIIAASPVNGYFSFGVLTWTSGNNLNQSIEILSQTDVGSGLQQLIVALEMADDIEAGDTFEIVAGCNKQQQTCSTKFNNINNFRGYPFVPGSDAIVDNLV